MIDSLSYQVSLIAETEIIANCGDVKIHKAIGPLYDYIVRDKSQGLQFAVNVVSHTFLRTKSFQDYLKTLDSADYSINSNQLPILLMAVNEQSRTASIGYVLAWHRGRPYIYHNINMRPSNERNWVIVLNQLLSMNEIIRILNRDGIKIVKHISVEHNINGIPHFGEIVYLRSFSDAYKMKQKVVKTDKERFDRMLFGIPEDEYPSDELDTAILNAVRSVLTAKDPVSKTLLFSTDLSELQFYKRNYSKANGILAIEPDMAQVAMLKELPNIPISKTIPIEFYSGIPQDSDTFDGLSFISTLSLEEWMNQEVYRELATYCPLSSIFE